MRPHRGPRRLVALGTAVLAFLAAVPAEAAPEKQEALLVPESAEGLVPVLVRTDDRAGVAAHIRALGGTVSHVFENLDAVAGAVPRAAMAELAADPRVGEARRQRLVRRAVVADPVPAIPGLRRARAAGEIVPVTGAGMSMRALAREELAPAPTRTDPSSFFGYDVLTGAADAWETAGFGDGVIVAVIDNGVYSGHPMIAGNVIGGQNLVPTAEEQAIDLDGDFVPDGLSFDWDAIENNPHGTFVSGVIAGAIELTMPETDPFTQSILAHTPESVELDGDGNAMVRVTGIAPGASIYGIKVFPYNGAGAPDARVAAAIDGLIQAKRAGTLDTDIINMSLSGPVLHDGWNPLDRMVDAATDAGITVVSAASNDGPSLMSVGSPASAFTGLAVGGVSDPIHTRIALETFFGGPGLGSLLYPHEDPLPVDFASRGLSADRRAKPDLVATAFFVFSSTVFDTDQDGLADAPGFGIGSGTSFSSPAVAGAAALVHAYGEQLGRPVRAPWVANALRHAAVPIADFGEISQMHQGLGFVNVPAALVALETGAAAAAPAFDRRNAAMAELDVRGGGSASGTTGPIGPGRTFDFLVNVPNGTTSLYVEFPDVQTGSGNPIVPEAATAAIHTAKRGGTGDYVFFRDGFFSPLTPGDSFELPFPEPGTMRVTIGGLFTNWADVSASVVVEARRDPLAADWSVTGRLTRDEVVQHTVEVPAGLAAMGVRLAWRHDWTALPTYDLDMYIETPDGFVPAASLDSPELAWIEAPAAGTYTFTILDYGTVQRMEPYDLSVLWVPVPAPEARGPRVTDAPRPRIAGVVPNPARGSAELSFSVPRQEEVALRVFDVSGRAVRTLVEGVLPAGPHRVTWDGRTADGTRAADGVYFLRLETEEGSSTRKVTLLK